MESSKGRHAGRCLQLSNHAVALEHHLLADIVGRFLGFSLHPGHTLVSAQPMPNPQCTHVQPFCFFGRAVKTLESALHELQIRLMDIAQNSVMQAFVRLTGRFLSLPLESPMAHSALLRVLATIL
jgi:hypothetical protein